MTNETQFQRTVHLQFIDRTTLSNVQKEYVEKSSHNDNRIYQHGQQLDQRYLRVSLSKLQTMDDELKNG
ncbi:unnamed protein product [Didymodactylos carnosus]|uniref:Uncharacterized protein n=1 Tax=Didymodactylos carnosus TaxID=1234261 RepID=A0A8S2EQP6_9BILA|nr:unnamed protein product [Didymodactylos carnosus]CAF4036619.1 unnamed protein product [Didymodactylos carnosus]